jgi:hypothetical protein
MVIRHEPVVVRHYGVRVYTAGSGDDWVTANGKPIIFNCFDEALNKSHTLNQGNGAWFVPKEYND